MPDSVRFDLDALYDGLRADYRGTPFAQRATDLQAALDSYRPAPDTLSLVPPADSLARADSNTVFADSLGLPPPDSTLIAMDGLEGGDGREDGDERSAFQEQADQAVDAAISGMPTPAEAGPPGDRITDDEPEVIANRFEQSDLIGTQPLDAFLGGFSWQVAVSENRESMGIIRESYQRQGFRTALYAVDLETGPGFGLLVGQFTTAPEARAARGLLQNASQGNMTLIAIGELQLLDEELGEDGED